MFDCFLRAGVETCGKVFRIDPLGLSCFFCLISYLQTTVITLFCLDHSSKLQKDISSKKTASRSQLLAVSAKGLDQITGSLLPPNESLSGLGVPSQAEHDLPGELLVLRPHQLVAGDEHLPLHLLGKLLPPQSLAVRAAGQGCGQEFLCRLSTSLRLLELRRSQRRRGGENGENEMEIRNLINISLHSRF